MTSLPSVRQAAVAGAWYPSSPDTLAQHVDAHLAGVAGSPEGAPVAIIAPHAGLMYSGPIAAHAYRLLRGRDFSVAVIVGPSHFVAFEGVALYDRGAFATPFGPVPIAEDCASVLLTLSPRITVRSDAHLREHSLEMQLPFLKRVLPTISIVPLVMGRQTRPTAYELGDAIAAALTGRSAIIIASTDLSHYQNARVAARLDNEVIGHVKRFDADGLMSLLEESPEHACGGGPTVAVMRAAHRLGARDARVLKYGDSGDVSGDKDAVVGYLAAAFGAFSGAS